MIFFECRDTKLTETFIQFGTLKTMEYLYSHVKNYHSFQISPERVKSKLNISSELFKKEDINFVVSHQGNLSYKNFDYVYCSICQKDKVHTSRKYKEKLPDTPKNK